MAPGERHRPVVRAPTFEDLFEVMARASVGETAARVDLPDQPDPEDLATRFGIALNLLLDDLAEHTRHAEREAKRSAEAEARAKAFELEKLREVDRLKGHIINTGAHELNTPLTPMVLQADLLHSGRLGPLNARQAQAARIIDSSAKRLVRLVHDMLDVARLQDGRLRVEPRAVALGQVLGEALEAFREPAARGGVALALACPDALRVRADPTRIGQVLANLLANALRGTPAGGRVAVEAEAGTDAATVRVRDTGIGLTPDQVARLFQPFSQVHPAEHGPSQGSGLGLFICKGIVEQHGGRIWAASEGPGRGATFAFTLPLATPYAEGPGTLQ